MKRGNILHSTSNRSCNFNSLVLNILFLEIFSVADKLMELHNLSDLFAHPPSTFQSNSQDQPNLR